MQLIYDKVIHEKSMVLHKLNMKSSLERFTVLRTKRKVVTERMAHATQNQYKKVVMKRWYDAMIYEK